MNACRKDIAQHLKRSMDRWNEKYDTNIVWSGKSAKSHGYVGRIRTAKYKITYWRGLGKRDTVYVVKTDGTLGKPITGMELTYINKIENESF